MSRGEPPKNFEETYPQHEFAPLVGIALFLAGCIKGIIASNFRRVSAETDHHPAGPGHAH